MEHDITKHHTLMYNKTWYYLLLQFCVFIVLNVFSFCVLLNILCMEISLRLVTVLMFTTIILLFSYCHKKKKEKKKVTSPWKQKHFRNLQATKPQVTIGKQSAISNLQSTIEVWLVVEIVDCRLWLRIVFYIYLCIQIVVSAIVN